jgi:hypothetical protein
VYACDCEIEGHKWGRDVENKSGAGIAMRASEYQLDSFVTHRRDSLPKIHSLEKGLNPKS